MAGSNGTAEEAAEKLVEDARAYLGCWSAYTFSTA